MTYTFVLLLLTTLLQGAESRPPQHGMFSYEALPWPKSPAPVQSVVVEGNAQAPGPFTMMLKLADGAWIPPHFHNVEKRLIVIRGELLMGHGDTIDASRAQRLSAGSVAVVPAGTRHFEGGRGETVIALIATGPFTTTRIGQQ
jgi:quercetin dioxygenase-like cupin family protein